MVFIELHLLHLCVSMVPQTVFRSQRELQAIMETHGTLGSCTLSVHSNPDRNTSCRGRRNHLQSVRETRSIPILFVCTLCLELLTTFCLQYTIRLVLSFYMFPPGWVPCFSIGIGVCFLVKNYLKEQYHNSRRVFRTWGLLTDALSVIFLLGWIGYGVSDSWARPSFATNTELGGRYWAAYISRLICPVGFLWFVGLCLGKGATGWLLSGTTIVEWLAPASYNIFLFHGPLSEIYFRATRGLWWSYPKSFYWFSPYPIPVANWEIPIVMAIVTVFSVAMHFYVNAKLIGASHWLLSCRKKQTNSIWVVIVPWTLKSLSRT